MSAVVNVDVGGVVDGLFSGLDKLFTSDEERAKAKLALQQELQKPHMQQAMITLAEAKHTNWFVAGWRPGIGWVCALCLLYHWLLKDIAKMIMVGVGTPGEVIALLPTIDGSAITGLVMALLGMGGLRTYEKLQGKAR